MRPKVLLPLAILFIAQGVFTNAQTEAAAGGAAPAAGDNGTLVLRYYDVGRPFALNCTAPRADPGQEYVWRKNGTVLEKVGELQGRYSLTADGSVLNVQGRSHEDDFGNYTCAAGEGAAHGWELRGRPHVRLPPNTNVVEGQKLKIVCKVTGKPYPAVSWTFSNDTENGTDVVRALGDRVVLQRSEAGVPDAELVVEVAQASDAGLYNCTLPEGTTDATRVRVKGMYAALWPFLGICAEVFVLCAIILVYERRRTKPELDDSDTDNHEQ